MTNQIFSLQNRSIIEISGPDRKKFLQGLVTNDVSKASEKNLIYAAMLNPQGRFLYDFFIFESKEILLIDCLSTRREEILQKLSFYKLRSKIEIKKNDQIEIFYSPNPLPNEESQSTQFIDPRNPQFGYRIYNTAPSQYHATSNLTDYHFRRISLKIPDSEFDLTYQKSFIIEFGFDELNAVNYQKGCYVGQEPTARIHHLGSVRKKIFHVEVADGFKQTVSNGQEITCEGKSVGIILSSVLHQQKFHALALIKLPDDENWQEKLELNGQKITIL